MNHLEEGHMQHSYLLRLARPRWDQQSHVDGGARAQGADQEEQVRVHGVRRLIRATLVVHGNLMLFAELRKFCQRLELQCQIPAKFCQ